jgi:hypothetical protein
VTGRRRQAARAAGDEAAPAAARRCAADDVPGWQTLEHFQEHVVRQRRRLRGRGLARILPLLPLRRRARARAPHGLESPPGALAADDEVGHGESTDWRVAAEWFAVWKEEVKSNAMRRRSDGEPIGARRFYGMRGGGSEIFGGV